MNEIQKQNQQPTDNLNLPYLHKDKIYLRKGPTPKANKNSEYYRHIKSLKQKTDSIKASPRIPNKE